MQPIPSNGPAVCIFRGKIHTAKKIGTLFVITYQVIDKIIYKKSIATANNTIALEVILHINCQSFEQTVAIIL